MVTKNPKDVLKRSMPASSIKKIEVITDPEIKYDAEGVSAILNIDTKSALQSYQGSISGNADSKGDWGVGAYFTTKVGKWEVTANYNYYNFVQPVWMNSTLDVKNASSPYSRSIFNTESTYDGGYHFGNVGNELRDRLAQPHQWLVRAQRRELYGKKSGKSQSIHLSDRRYHICV